MNERERERKIGIEKVAGKAGRGVASEGASVERTKKRSQGELPSRRRPWTTFLIATSSRGSPRPHQHASELLRTIRTKGKQFSVDAAADAYLITPSNLLHSHPLCHGVRLSSFLPHVKSPRVFLLSHGGQLLPPTSSSCPPPPLILLVLPRPVCTAHPFSPCNK